MVYFVLINNILFNLLCLDLADEVEVMPFWRVVGPWQAGL